MRRSALGDPKFYVAQHDAVRVSREISHPLLKLGEDVVGDEMIFLEIRPTKLPSSLARLQHERTPANAVRYDFGE
jgi:hypothetical protein